MPASTQRRPVENAFTLIELLVVIGIVALLAALMLPAISNIKAQGKATKCSSNLRQIFMASMSWSQDNNGIVLPVYSPVEGLADSLSNWTGLIAPYVGRTSATPFSAATDLLVATCPLHPSRFGYGHNYLYLSYPYAKGRPKDIRWASIQCPAETVFFCDNKSGAGESTVFKNSWRTYVRPPRFFGLNDWLPSFGHPGKTANVLWLDGHVSAEKEPVKGQSGISPVMEKDAPYWNGQGTLEAAQ